MKTNETTCTSKMCDKLRECIVSLESQLEACSEVAGVSQFSSKPISEHIREQILELNTRCASITAERDFALYRAVKAESALKELKDTILKLILKESINQKKE